MSRPLSLGLSWLIFLAHSTRWTNSTCLKRLSAETFHRTFTAGILCSLTSGELTICLEKKTDKLVGFPGTQRPKLIINMTANHNSQPLAGAEEIMLATGPRATNFMQDSVARGLWVSYESNNMSYIAIYVFITFDHV